MVCSGAPEPEEHHASLLTECGLDMQGLTRDPLNLSRCLALVLTCAALLLVTESAVEFAKHWKVPIGVRIGVNSGGIIAGVGSGL